MSGINYTKIYQDWPDEKLLTEYASGDYMKEATDAMEAVIRERDLWEKAEERCASEQKKMRAKESKKAEGIFSTPIQADLKSTLSDEEYAETSESDGVYFEKTMMSGASSNLVGFTIAMAITALVFLIVMGYAEFLTPFSTTLLVGAMLLFVIWSVYLLRNNKCYLRVYKMGRTPYIEVKTAKKTWEFKAPFTYRCYGQMVDSANRYVRIKRPNLYILLEHSDGKTLMLHEDKSALNSMPQGWEQVDGRYELLRRDFRVTQHGTNAVELEKLRRILDSLSKTG